MFVFEDIVTLDNRSIQRIIRDCDNEDLILSLKVSSEEVQEVLYRNMSQTNGGVIPRRNGNYGSCSFT